MRAGYYGVVCGSLVLTVLAGDWAHLQHTPLWHSERAVIMSHSILGKPPHVERPFLSGPPAEQWKTSGATSGAVGTLYESGKCLSRGRAAPLALSLPMSPHPGISSRQRAIMLIFQDLTQDAAEGGKARKW
jgi:hypothetical protein